MPWADPYYGYIKYREDTREMYTVLRKRFDENRVREKEIQETQAKLVSTTLPRN